MYYVGSDAKTEKKEARVVGLNDQANRFVVILWGVGGFIGG